MAKDAGAIFYPFVVESFGGFGEKAIEFIDAFVRASKSSHSAWCPHEIAFDLLRIVVAALCRGNPRMIARALSLLVREERQWCSPVQSGCSQERHIIIQTVDSELALLVGHGPSD